MIPMPRKLSMSWEPSANRWKKEFDKKIYRVTCKQLGLPRSQWTQKHSQKHANSWWEQKAQSLGVADVLEIIRTKEQFIEKSENMYGKKYCYDKVNYINQSTKVSIICNKFVDGVKVGCGITFSKTPTNHIQGQGCANCAFSKGEKAILKFFEDKGWKEGVNFLHQHKTKTCRIDFVIKELNLLIEYNGGQHYIPTSFGSKRKNAHIINLKSNINSDHKRIKFCLKKGSLLIIPYWDFKNINQILEDFLEGRMPTFSKPPKEVIKYKKIRDRIRKELKITGAEILCGVVREVAL